jgi:hypothetical protein
MDVFPLVVSLLPLATYFLLLGGLRVLRRPLVTTGARDGLAIGIAVSGLVMVGPGQLFFPSMAAAELGWYVWVVLGVFYLLCVSLILLTWQPRVVIYGLRSDDALQHLLAVAQTVDSDATVDAGTRKVVLPQRQVTLRVDSLGITDAVQIEAFEKNLHPRFWRHLVMELRRRTATTRVPLSVGGAGMLIVGSVLLTVVLTEALSQRGELMAGFRQWLNV